MALDSNLQSYLHSWLIVHVVNLFIVAYIQNETLQIASEEKK